MIAVAGATGRLGTLVVRRLAASGMPVRALTRDPRRAGHLLGAARDVVSCDVRDRESLLPALRDAATVVSAVHGFAGPGRVSPESVDRDGNANLVDVAAAQHSHVVLVSIVGAAPDSPMELVRAKWAAEEHLRATCDAWTIVRASAFVELWAELLGRSIVFGRGENPINFVSVTDVADAVVRAATEPQLRGQVVEVTGPSDLTFNELADLLLRIRGSPAKVRHVPRWALRMLAPLARQPRAALAMDTIDLTAAATRSDTAIAHSPVTDVAAALRITT